jgi:hypothetical protein
MCNPCLHYLILNFTFYLCPDEGPVRPKHLQSHFNLNKHRCVKRIDPESLNIKYHSSLFDHANNTGSFNKIFTKKTRSREEYHITTDEIWRTVHSDTSQVYLERAKLLHNSNARWQAEY